MRLNTRDLKGGGRVIRGQVSSTGAIVSGTGFTILKTGTGLYTIVFAVPFAAPPVVVAVPVGASFAGAISSGPATVTTCAIASFTTDTRAGLDSAWSFTATEQER